MIPAQRAVRVLRTRLLQVTRVWPAFADYVFHLGMKVVLFVVGFLITFSARADVEAGWQIGTWVVDTDRTMANIKPSSLVPKDSMAKIKSYLDSALLTFTGNDISFACPADGIRPEIDVKCPYTIEGMVKGKMVVVEDLGPHKIERVVLAFDSKDQFSFLLKIIPGRMYWKRLKE
jgi:hypothetical protein